MTNPAPDRERDPSCLFCRMAAGELSPSIEHEDDLVLAIRDIAPQAPTHILLIPREHIPSVADLADADAPVLGRLFAVGAELARREGLVEPGYRIVSNVGRDGGQSVEHLHLHLLGGCRLSWPPG